MPKKVDVRFEEAPERAYKLLGEILKEHEGFDQLRSAKILILMDCKKRMNGDFVTLASFQKANDLDRFLSMDEVGDDGYDYILRFDKVLWGIIEDEDRIRILRHELKHADVDIEAKNPWKVRPHEIEDFFSEVDFNSGEPDWRMRVGNSLLSKYEEIETSQKKLKGF